MDNEPRTGSRRLWRRKSKRIYSSDEGVKKMKALVKPLAAAVAVGALLVHGPARAQQAPAAAQPAGSPLSDVLTRVSQVAGIRVVADSSVATQRVLPPNINAVTADTLETQLAEIVGALPRGTQWARVYLPATANSRTWTGDAVADYVYAQSKLFGAVGAATPAGTVEIMGQRVAADQARTLITALNLRPVYLITNPARRPAGGAGVAGDPSQWSAMSPEQQQQYAQQQAQQLLNMDPAARTAMLQQQISVLGTMMQQMTPEQRRDMMQNVGAGLGFMGRGGFGGQGGGNQGGGRRRGGGNQGGGGGNNF
jgi:uncharacterized membrane protein YgcG